MDLSKYQIIPDFTALKEILHFYSYENVSAEDERAMRKEIEAVQELAKEAERALDVAKARQDLQDQYGV